MQLTCLILRYSHSSIPKLKMLRCEGRPDSACPEGKNDSSVKLSMGELMLCLACENFRYPMLAASKSARKAAVSISTTDTPLTTIPTMAASKTTVPPSVKDSSLTSTHNLTRNNSTQCDNLVQCELLFFMNSTFGKRPDGIIRQTILDFYGEDEIMYAKQLLVSATDSIDGLNIHTYMKNRIGCNKVKSTVKIQKHNTQLENYYTDIVKCLNKASQQCVRNIKTDFQKEWWRSELDELKQACIDMTTLWSSLGRPRSGCINAERLRCKYRYKQAIKMAAQEHDRSFNDDIYEHLCEKR